MKIRIFSAIIAITAMMSVVACTSKRTDKSTDATDNSSTISAVATFNADSAFSHVRRQVEMGPRTPGSKGHAACEDYIISTLRADSAVVSVQNGTVTAYTGETLPVVNILGSFNPEAKTRILLVAHYDTRPWADQEESPESASQPVPGANDGASGVGVLLEIARKLGKNPPEIGVDLLFTDVEDYGNSGGFGNNDETWCLGTQYWLRNMPYTIENKPIYAILLDMVGGINARFHREFFSDEYASGLVDKVWSTAARSGFSEIFVNKRGGSIIDDHIFINRAGIPAIDIIESHNDQTHSFAPTWHTLSDDVDHIDRNSLNAVGQTILNMIYSETNPS